MIRTHLSGIQPDSVKVYQIEEILFTLSLNTYDIWEYLKLFEIKPHQIININLKERNYTWNENYITPEFTTIRRMTGDKYKNGGKENVVIIMIKYLIIIITTFSFPPFLYLSPVILLIVVNSGVI